MSPLELTDNILQLTVTLYIGIIACVSAIKRPLVAPFQYLAGASLSMFIGTLYWTIYFVIYSDFPYYFSASELSYMSLYLFLISVCLLLFKQYKTIPLTHKQILFSSLFPIWVLIINIICYLLVGGLFATLYYCIPLMILAYTSYQNIFILKRPMLRYFNFTIIAFVIINNIMFLVSSFMWNTLYVLLDMLLTTTFMAMLLFLKKESKL